MKQNPLLKLQGFGQSVWLDFLSRGLLVSGELVSLIQQDGVSGVTSNPAIFEKAIAHGSDYDRAITELAREGKSAAEIYETLVVEDIRMTADLLLPLYQRLEGRDGFVSLEVSPLLAHDSGKTIEEARRLWQRVDRPNLYIKVPGTGEGLIAIGELIREGINVNVTLLFGLERYRAVVESYLDGLSARAAHSLPLEKVSSVASFFLSRIDVVVDPLLDRLIEEGGRRGEIALSLRGQTAIACAKLAHQIYRETLSDDRYLALAGRGARPQRVLWASTGAKDPSFSDVKYVEPLIGPDTINTMPMETLAAYRDHGDPSPRLDQGVPEAMQVLERLPELGIDLDAVTRQLEDEGVEKFRHPFESLAAVLEEKRQAALK
ncbi:transaldolase [Geomonas sp. Red32]|uniref:transaldolase n=1 Tax=Geomonas sp. Red32 TaxID=2912856 RepID=UPI00202CE92B|nr:transaldolase [Geomonas sp. Red32]MCM0084152.1 transaldolase [Geomonas sp. Red32]